MSLRQYSCEDPFSAAFETHVEEALSDTELSLENHFTPPTIMPRPKPVIQPKPTQPVDTFVDAHVCAPGQTAMYTDPSSISANASTEEEYWPPPPDGLDQFGTEPTANDPTNRHVEPGPTYPPFMNRTSGHAKDDEDTDDTWSTTCDQGSKLSIMDGVAADPELPPPAVTARQTGAERARARSEVIRNRQRHQYDNCEALPLNPRPTEAAARTRSCEVFKYENVALPQEIAGSRDTRESGKRNSENSSGSDTAVSAYENVFITEEQRVSVSHSTTSSDARGSSVDGADDLEELEGLSEADSYYTDSDFDCDSGEEIQDFLNDTLSPGSECSSTRGQETTDERRKNIVRQLLEVERNYVRKLHFLCRVVMVNLRVLQRIPGIAGMPADTQKQIFINLEVIFNFHAENLLPALEEIMTNWGSQAGLGNMFKRLVPYFRLYIDYQEGHKQALVQYDSWLKKNAVFAALVEEVQQLPECGRLTMRQLLVEISNQVPKYEMALKELSDLSPARSPDGNDLLDAVDSLNQTCFELAKAMGKEDRIKVLREVQGRLDIPYTIVKATRELKHECKIQTVHPGNARLLDRYIFLFNDLLLICGPRLMNGKHEVRFKLENQTLNLYEGDNLTIRYTFYIQSESKAFECACRTGTDKCGVMRIIQTEVEGSKQWSLYGRVMFRETANPTTDPNVGKHKPEMQQCPDSGVQSCTLCNTAMSTLRRRYHCMACGKIVCAKCSQQKAPLEYDGRRQSKVCDACYTVIHTRELSCGTSTMDMAQYQVKSQDPGHISGYLRLSSTKGKSWHRRWFLVKSDGILYCFKQNNADQVWSFLPLARFSMTLTSNTDPVYKSTAFKLVSSRRTYFLQADSIENIKTWTNTLANFCDSTV